MRLDKYKNKDRAKLIPEKEKHVKEKKRHVHRDKTKVRDTLKNITAIEFVDPEELDDFDLDKFEKFGT